MSIKNLALNKEVRDSQLGNAKRIINLTDGRVGTPSSRYAENWTCFGKTVEKSLYIDLQADFAVTGFDIGFLHDAQNGVCPPEEVKFYLSENGNDYYEIATAKAPYNASFNMCVRALYSAKLDTAVLARYVIIKFGIDGETFCDELRVFGSDCDGAERRLQGAPISFDEKGCFASPACLDGVKNIFSVRFGGNEKILGIEDFISCVSYVDSMEMPRDIMSDAIVFEYVGDNETLSDWEAQFDLLFAKNRSLRALDKVVGLIKTTLKLDENYKYKIYIKTPSPKISLNPFGDLNGDGIVEKLLSSEDCVCAYSWFLDDVIRRFNSERYENIVIDGFVWGDDKLSRANREDEIEFAKACINEIHKRNYKSLFVASFGAAGCEKAEEIGFDCILMKPERRTENAISTLAPLCKKYGFGVALETDNMLFDNLYGCIENGMMSDTVHIFCQSATGTNIFGYAYSKSSSEKSVYQKLYEFINGGKPYVPLDDEETFSVSELVKTPATEMAESSTVEEEPIVEVEEPVAEVETPIVEVEEPVVEVETPIVEVEESVAEVETPIVEVEEPVAEVETPIVEVEEPVAEVETPIVEVEEPVVEVETPIVEVEEPVAEVETPIVEAEEPVPEIHQGIIPESEIKSEINLEQKIEPEVESEQESGATVANLQIAPQFVNEKEIKIELELDLSIPPEVMFENSPEIELKLEGFPDDVNVPEVKLDIENVFGDKPVETTVKTSVGTPVSIVTTPVKTEIKSENEVKPNPIITQPVFETKKTVPNEKLVVPENSPTKETTETIENTETAEIPVFVKKSVSESEIKMRKAKMLGAGVAATLGTAYLIIKAIKGKD